jgi:dipeptidyl aminopeptidase/acylaminoacyl peptidase
MRALWIMPVLAGGCSFHHGELPTDATTDAAKEIDARVVDAAIAIDSMLDAPDGLGAWSTPVPITELNSDTGDDDPSLTSDLLEIYFGTKRLNQGDEDIFVAKRTATTQAWGTPALVANINTFSNETTGKVAADGLTIYFSSNRANVNDYQLYGSTRASRAVAFPAAAVIGFSSTSTNEYSPSPRPDLKRLIFCAGPTVAQEGLWVSTRTLVTNVWGAPSLIAELDNAGSSECDPMEPNDLTVYFSSNRTGDSDLYVARRTAPNQPYGAPTAVTELNTAGSNDRDPWVSADERLMIFSSSRGDGTDRLYMTTR